MILLSLAIAQPISAPAARSTPTAILRTQDGNVLVQRANVDDDVVVTVELPTDWSFSIKIDGDQDGVWGAGPYAEANSYPQISADTVYTEWGDRSELCTQYILAAWANDPDLAYLSTQCGEFASKARLVTEKLANKRRRMIFSIPSAELFSLADDANVQFCVWNTKTTDCTYSPTTPYIMTRKLPPVDPDAIG